MIWVTFVGEGRSGHTVLSGALGSRLDARISEEQKYISKWRRGYNWNQIMQHLNQSGVGHARRDQGWPNLQRYDELLLVGDKCGWDAVNEYRKRGAPATILKDFEEFMDMPVKTLVTVRHPLDNITAWVDSPKYKRIFPDEALRFRRMIRRYKQFHEAAWDILQYADYQVVPHEALCAHPNMALQEISDFIGLPKNKEWRREAGKRIHTKPHLRRDDIKWPTEYIDRVDAFIAESPLLEYYR